MKKFSKLALALALGAVSFGPLVENSYAVESTQDSYTANYNELFETYRKADSLRSLYPYMNASHGSRDYFTDVLGESMDLVLINEDDIANIDEAKNQEIIAMNQKLKEAMESLDGKIVDFSELDRIVADHENFIKSKAYQDARDDQKEIYLKALDGAKENYDRDRERVMQALYNIDLKVLKERKEGIERAKTNPDARDKFFKALEDAQALKEKKDLYTEESFDEFIAKLDLIESSYGKTDLYYNDDFEYAKIDVEDTVDLLVKKDQGNDKDTEDKANEDATIEEESQESQAGKDDKKLSQEELIARLKKSMRRNEITMEAAKLLMRTAPDVVAPHKAELDALIARSDKLIKRANAYLESVENKTK